MSISKWFRSAGRRRPPAGRSDRPAVGGRGPAVSAGRSDRPAVGCRRPTVSKWILRQVRGALLGAEVALVPATLFPPLFAPRWDYASAGRPLCVDVRVCCVFRSGVVVVARFDVCRLACSLLVLEVHACNVAGVCWFRWFGVLAVCVCIAIWQSCFEAVRSCLETNSIGHCNCNCYYYDDYYLYYCYYHVLREVVLLTTTKKTIKH